MAKKKSVKKEVTKEANIVYSGNVTVKLVKDGKTLKTVKKHNTGCSELFDFLSECLMGNFVQGKMPKVLMGYYNNEDPTATSLGTKVLSTFVPYADIDKISVEDDNYKVEYKFNIPALIVNTSTHPINVLALFNMNNANESASVPSAFIKLDSSKEITPDMVSSGVNIIVLWDMQFSNPSSN